MVAEIYSFVETQKRAEQVRIDQLAAAAEELASAMVIDPHAPESAPIDLHGSRSFDSRVADGTLGRLWTDLKGYNREPLLRKDGGEDIVWTFVQHYGNDPTVHLFVREVYSVPSGEDQSSALTEASFEKQAPEGYLEAVKRRRELNRSPAEKYVRRPGKLPRLPEIEVTMTTKPEPW